MENFWEILNRILDTIIAFVNWYLYDTPLFEDTLDTIYAWGVNTYQIVMPLIEEYIQYIGQYIGG